MKRYETVTLKKYSSEYQRFKNIDSLTDTLGYPKAETSKVANIKAVMFIVSIMLEITYVCKCLKSSIYFIIYVINLEVYDIEFYQF